MILRSLRPERSASAISPLAQTMFSLHDCGPILLIGREKINRTINRGIQRFKKIFIALKYPRKNCIYFYHLMDNPTNEKGIYEQSAGFVILREDKKGQRLYLLLHYPGGHIDFPKGHIEKGETKIEAALRELEEETGISKVKLMEGYKEKIHYFYKHQGKLMSKDVFFYLALTKQKNVNISFEHKNYYWLPYEEALQKITFENSKQLLRKAEEFMLRHQINP